MVLSLTLFRLAGETPKDLSFVVGEKLTILKPDIAMYWYVAQNDRGQRGIIPFNLIEVSLMELHYVKCEINIIIFATLHFQYALYTAS